MFVKYVERRFSAKTLETIDGANAIIDEYQSDGFSLTLRQLYYQFVARGLVENSLRSYKLLGSVVNDGRLAGLISWTAIEDRTRGLRSLPHWDSPASILAAARDSYSLDKWRGQGHRVEVWVEKDALSGVIEPACSELDVPFLSCRGYVSQSEMWKAAARLAGYERRGLSTVVLHLGDHDPSGVDMTRDVQDRLRMFGCGAEVRRIALNMDQVREHNPPPNPAKIQDSRCAAYIREFGHESWELDALEPRALDSLIREHVLEFRDEAELGRVLEREARDLKYLDRVIEDADERGRS